SWSITLALSSAESPFSQTIKSKNEKRIFVPSTDRIRNLVQLALSSAESPFSQTIKSKNEKRIFVPSTDRIRNLNEKRIFVPSTDRIRNLVHSSGPPCISRDLDSMSLCVSDMKAAVTKCPCEKKVVKCPGHFSSIGCIP
ncbi:hypothetical protein L9F63_009245, partial [Diploptera punctata]